MQFRMHTLFLMTITVAIMLAISGSSPPWARIGVVFSTGLIWLSLGLVGVALNQRGAGSREGLFLMLSLSVFTVAFAGGTYFLSFILKAQFG